MYSTILSINRGGLKPILAMGERKGETHKIVAGFEGKISSNNSCMNPVTEII